MLSLGITALVAQEIQRHPIRRGLGTDGEFPVLAEDGALTFSIIRTIHMSDYTDS